MSFGNPTPKILVLDGLILASALTTANAVTSLVSDESANSKLGKVGVAALIIAGTAIAGATILNPNKDTVPKNLRR